MDEERRYAEEPEPRWYSGPGASPYESGAHERPDYAYRLPEPREADRYSTSHAALDDGEPVAPRTALDAIRVPLRPTEYPAVRPTSVSPGDTGTHLAAPAPVAPPAPAAPNLTAGPAFTEPTSFVPPLGVRTADGPGSDRFAADRGAAGRLGGDTVYRTRRPASAVILAVVTGLLMVPVIRLLVQATFVDPPLARGIVPAVLMALGLPLTGLGLYGLAGAGGATDRSALLRPPAGYLLVGLVLLLAAGLATA